MRDTTALGLLTDFDLHLLIGDSQSRCVAWLVLGIHAEAVS